jgi:hypothetical protein
MLRAQEPGHEELEQAPQLEEIISMGVPERHTRSLASSLRTLRAVMVFGF